MKEKKLLTTKQIARMPLKEFMRYKPDSRVSVTAKELCDADSDWLLLRDLESCSDWGYLRWMISQAKESLWYRIRDARNKGGGDGET